MTPVVLALQAVIITAARERVARACHFYPILFLYTPVDTTCYEFWLVWEAALCGHSTRRAWVGEMDAARLAGMMAAKKEQMARAMAEMERARGSQEETP
jgi:hypothetical protein